jgi:hypothetical protein
MEQRKARQRGMQLSLLDQRPELARIRVNLPDGWREEVGQAMMLMVDQHLQRHDGDGEGTDE